MEEIEMSDKDIAKTAFELAEKEAREQKISTVKAIVIETLKKLDDIRKQIKDLQEKERILKLDIEDLKAGKLDLIAERQEKDQKAKEVSVVVIVKEKEIIREVSPWYWPYYIHWQIPVPSYPLPIVWCGNGNTIPTLSNSNSGILGLATSGYSDFIDCSVAKDAVPGTYNVCEHTVHLR
jgi:hypothetical protein